MNKLSNKINNLHKIKLIKKQNRKHILKDVAQGDYVTRISRQRFLTHYGIISVAKNACLSHRELSGGDINGDIIIDEKDFSVLKPNECSYGNKSYNHKYDINGDKVINHATLPYYTNQHECIRRHLPENSRFY